MGAIWQTERASRGKLAAVALAGAAAIAAGAVVGPSFAQEQDPLPGADIFFDFTTGLVFSDNYEAIEDPSGTSTVWLTDVALTFDSRTRNQSFVGSIGATYEAGDFADRDSNGQDLINPFLSVDYSIENRSTLLSFGASYRERDNGFSDDEATSGVDLVIDQGTRADTSFSTILELGRDAPLGFRANASWTEREFFDTEDPDLTDQIRYSLDTQIRLAINQATTLTFDSAYSEREEQNNANTFETTASFGFGFEYENASGYSVVAGLRTAIDETTETINGDRRTSTEESPLLNVSVIQQRPNGSLSYDFEQDLSDTGRRTRLSFGRDLELRSGSLGFSFGVTAAETDSEVRTFGSIDYQYELPRGRLDFSFSTNVFTDDDDGDTIGAIGNFRWTQDLTQLDSLSLAIGLRATDVIDEDGTDRSQSTFEFAYQRSLTEDWGFNTGYRHRTARETDSDPTIENEIFANISRRFSIRP